jgi:DNA adenine methylase
VKPILKWAGNKYKIVDRIKEVLPESRRLIEPFVGSGAVFLNTNYSEYILADINADLISFYKTLQKEGESFIDRCRELFKPENNREEAYYALRERFNLSEDAAEKSAIFLYLNRHGYNGLCRYNRKGQFNVPFGQYRNPYFPEKEMEHFLEKCQNSKVEFLVQDFRQTMMMAREGDAVYCDPPYVPLSPTANFTDYSPEGFGIREQEELARLAKYLKQNKITVIISNHDTEFTSREYGEARIIRFPVRRYISCDGENRNLVPELLAVFGG